MMFAGLLCLFITSAASSHSSSITLEDVLESLENDLKQENFTESNCTETNWDVIKFLNLTKNKDQLVWTRPAKNSKTATRVNLDFLLYAILGVREKEQKFISYVWVDLIWKHYELHWDPDNFCGIKAVSIPTRLLWQPDLIIEERTEKNRAAESPLVHVNYRGWVLLRNDRVLVTTCRMQVYKFPFDSQSCTLSFKSVIHNSQQLLLKKIGNQSYTTEWTQEIMRTQSDWIFINITSSSKTVNNFDITQSMVVYTINMKRRSVLYVVNFIIPVLLFLVLDLASFMISENGGEMLTFKVTVLLAVTVMQLILNDILPSTSDKIPLIAIYCVGIFGFMMLSLLETVLVMYMMEQDSVPKDDEEVKHTVKHSLTEDCGVKQEIHQLLHFDVPADESASRRHSMSQKASTTQLLEESHDYDRELMAALTRLGSKKDGGKTGYWTRIAIKVNRIFFVSYVITVALFLGYLSYCWST